MAFSPSKGFNVVGHLDSLLGMGQAARNLIEVFHENDVPYQAVNVRLTESAIGPALKTNDDARFQNTIWAVNPERLTQAQRHLPKVTKRTMRSIGYWWWELNEVPPVFDEMSKRVDEVWAPSSFIAETLSQKLVTPVLRTPLMAPDIQAPNISDIDEIRQKLRLEISDFTVITAADLLSSIDRKNVHGAIEAFNKAFSSSGNATLVVKLLHAESRPSARTRIEIWAQGNPNIRIVDEPLSRQEMMALISSCDVLLSLHRSEGLGLHLMEAMAVSTCVVTSDYSGNLDFCTNKNCFLIQGHLVPLHDTSGQYLNLPNSYWFEPNIGQAADALKKLHEDPALRRNLETEGKNTYQKLRNSNDILRFIDDRVKTWSSSSADTHERKSSKRLLIKPESLKVPGFGVNLIGYLQSEFGMGEYSRRLLKALNAGQVPTRCEVLQSRGIRSTELLNEPLLKAHKDSLPFAVNLVVINADDFPRWAWAEGSGLIRDRYTVGVWAWELETFPQNLHKAFDYVDEIWAISKFSAAAISEFASVPVLAIPPLVDEANPVTLTQYAAARSDIGIDQNAFLVTFTFDYYGTLERKNPAGAIKAYMQAFEPNDGAILVLKSTNEASNPLGQKALHDLAAGRPDICFVEGYWSKQQVRALIGASDVYLSLHRSEGLGLGLSEALADGVAVIATDYGGHLDFANPTNAELIDYQLQPVGENAKPYPAFAKWADPNINAAAKKLRELFDESRAPTARSRASKLEPGLESAAETFISERLRKIYTELPKYDPSVAVLSPSEGTTEPEGNQKSPAWWQVNPTSWFGFQSFVKDLDISNLTAIIHITNVPFRQKADVTVTLAESIVKFELKEPSEAVEVSFPLQSITQKDEIRIDVDGQPWQPDGDPRSLYLLVGPTLVVRGKPKSHQPSYRVIKESNSPIAQLKSAVRQLVSKLRPKKNLANS